MSLICNKTAAILESFERNASLWSAALITVAGNRADSRDVSLWATIAACLFLTPTLVEFAYFAGIAGAGMALLTPNLWSPWPTYPAIYFFVARGGIVIANIVLIYGGIFRLRPGALWRAVRILVAFAAVGAFNAVFKTNYTYLYNKPKSASLLDAFGPWPIYLLVAFGLSLVLYTLLRLPLRTQRS